MRIVLQRVTKAHVAVAGETVAAIGPGLLLLVGVAAGDGDDDIALLADKIATLRVFSDDRGLLNRSVTETGGEILAVSQFTLMASWRRGRRPSFSSAAPGPEANALFERFVERLRGHRIACFTGRFGAMMQVELVNDGPVTIILDSREVSP